MTTLEDVHELSWNARSVARFWEPGAEAWARKRLHLPEGGHVSAAMLDKLRIDPYREQDGPVPGNRLVTFGLAALTNQLVNGVRAWTPTSGGSGYVALAVGTGTTADAIADQDMSGGSKFYRVCDNTYPTRSNGVLTFLTTYASGEANFSWDEYGVFVPTSGSAAFTGGVTSRASLSNGNHVMLNRKSPAGLGVKSNGSTASLQLTITIL